jgi:hypothetical protein
MRYTLREVARRHFSESELRKSVFHLRNKVGFFFLILHFLLPGLKWNVKGITYYTDTSKVI